MGNSCLSKHKRTGFTLIELIVVIAILAILALIAVPSLGGYLMTAKARRNEANAKLATNIAKMIFADTGYYPGDGVTSVPSGIPVWGSNPSRLTPDMTQYNKADVTKPLTDAGATPSSPLLSEEMTFDPIDLPAGPPITTFVYDGDTGQVTAPGGTGGGSGGGGTGGGDTTAPVLSALSVGTIGQNSAILSYTSNEAGTYYFLVYVSMDAAPDANTVKAQGTAVSKGTGAALASINTASLSGLASSTSYKAYVVVVDSAANTSLVGSPAAFTTTSGGGGGGDTTAPVLTGQNVTPQTTSALLEYTSDEAGTLFYSLGPSSAADLMADSLVVGGQTSLAVSGPNTASLVGLTASTGYRVQFVVRDAAGNVSTVSRLAFTTAPLADTTAPVVSAVTGTATSATTGTLSFSTNEAGTYFFLVLLSSAPTPDANTVIAQGTAVVKGTASAIVGANTAGLSGMSASTGYKAHVVVRDGAGNVSSVGSSSLFSTPAPSLPAPVLRRQSNNPGSWDYQDLEAVGCTNGATVTLEYQFEYRAWYESQWSTRTFHTYGTDVSGSSGVVLFDNVYAYDTEGWFEGTYTYIRNFSYRAKQSKTGSGTSDY